MKDILDNLVLKYETPDFINKDPIQFAHRYKTKTDIEIAAFIASLFAYGKRELFIHKLNLLFDYFDSSPTKFISNINNISHVKNIEYRFSKNIDICQILEILHILYRQDNGSLEMLFSKGWEQSNDIFKTLQFVSDYFYTKITKNVTSGFYHLLPNPSNNSPMKRMNMFLRWLIREGNVDLGIWRFIKKSELLIPLDVHVARVSRELNLLNRSSNDATSVRLLTQRLKEFDSSDPVKYDFAIFGLGVSNELSPVQPIQS